MSHGTTSVISAKDKHTFQLTTMSLQLQQTLESLVVSVTFADHHGLVDTASGHWNACSEQHNKLCCFVEPILLCSTLENELRNTGRGRGNLGGWGKLIGRFQMWWCRHDDPDILEHPRGAHRFTWSPFGVEKNLIVRVHECACVHGGFSFLRDDISLLQSCLSVKWFQPVLFNWNSPCATVMWMDPAASAVCAGWSLTVAGIFPTEALTSRSILALWSQLFEIVTPPSLISSSPL